MKRMKSAGLKMKLKKFFFVQKKVNLLSHIADENGINLDPENDLAGEKAPRCTSKTDF